VVRSGASPRLPAAVGKSLANASPTPFWLDQPDAPESLPALAEHVTTELAVVGGGFTGLWTALLAKERDPSRDVVLLEARTVGWAASGRNGGFCSASLTHGIGNGLERFPDEMPLLEKLGEQNLRELNSPALVGGLKFTTGNALVEPGRLAWGLRRACLEAGVRMYEQTPVTSLTPGGTGLTLTTPYGSVRSGWAVLGTGVFGRSLLRRIGAYVIPVWDYALMTEPLSAAQLAALGWNGPRGAGDMSNQFHYFRMTRDNRMLWGGYDAVYYNGGRIRDEDAYSPATFSKLAQHFFTAFPQLEGVSFTHAWGGVIDTCSRFCAFFGSAYGGRLAYAAGYTGLGVGATRFGAQVLLCRGGLGPPRHGHHQISGTI
jgi:glycine/D-amino acid oxidase-like deaminating enzyme